MIKVSKVIDVSMPIREGMPVYKNKPEKQPAFETTSDFPTATAHETRIHMDVHTGTHVDAPLHMLPGGATSETITLEQLVKPCRVIDLMNVEEAIGVSDIQPHNPQPGEFLLFKTRNSLDEEFNFNFIYVTGQAAEFLAERKVSGVGVDGLGIERAQPDHPTHKALFSVGAVIIEGLRLAEVPAGEYLMVAAPIHLIGSDASPARVMLLSE